jgi:hypothetical protein
MGLMPFLANPIRPPLRLWNNQKMTRWSHTCCHVVTTYTTNVSNLGLRELIAVQYVEPASTWSSLVRAWEVCQSAITIRRAAKLGSCLAATWLLAKWSVELDPTALHLSAAAASGREAHSE